MVYQVVIINIQVSSSLITASVQEPQYYGNAGEYFFTTDPFTNTNPQLSGNELSDDYKLILNIQQESSAIWRRKTDNGGFWDSSDYDWGYIGYIKISLEKTTNTSLNTNSWTKCKTKSNRPTYIISLLW